MRLSTRLNHHLDQPSTATDMRQFAVATKKVYGGNRSAHGALTQQGLAAIVRTAQQRDLNFHAALVSMLRARAATIPVALQSRSRQTQPAHQCQLIQARSLCLCVVRSR